VCTTPADERRIHTLPYPLDTVGIQLAESWALKITGEWSRSIGIPIVAFRPWSVWTTTTLMMLIPLHPILKLIVRVRMLCHMLTFDIEAFGEI
jgi:hypothetical protein